MGEVKTKPGGAKVKKPMQPGKPEERPVGFVACWRDRLRAEGVVCRLPRGHEGDCIPLSGGASGSGAKKLVTT